MRFDLYVDGRINTVELGVGKVVTVRLNGKDFIVDITDDMDGMNIQLDGKAFRLNFEGPYVSIDGHRHTIEVRNLRRVQSPEFHNKIGPDDDDQDSDPMKACREDEIIYSPLPGSVIAIKVKVGDHVKDGSTILVLEAMKMQNEILSHTEGIVREIRVAEGNLVESGSVLVVIEK
jgi:biotin carboxyl carrier protein